jgi:hypothetical protein
MERGILYVLVLRQEFENEDVSFRGTLQFEMAIF